MGDVIRRLIEWFRNLFQKDEPVTIMPVELPPAAILPVAPDEPKPWVEMPCLVCKKIVQFHLNVTLFEINPYQMTVFVSQCEACATRWAAVLQPVQFAEADTLPLQEKDIIDDGYTD